MEDDTLDSKFNTPKGFGKILDHTFSLSKNKFAEFFTIFLIFIGPIYLLQALLRLITGTAFFREAGDGEFWFERTLMSFDETSSNIFADLGIIFVSFIGLFLYPMAQGAIMLAINHIRKNEEYTIGQVLKETLSRYGYLLASSFLFSMIGFGTMFVPIFLIVMIGMVLALIHPAIGILLGILLFIGLLIGGGFLLTKWSFYFGIVAIGEDQLGFSKSWKLTRNRTWGLMGLYFVFFLIISSITYAVEISFGLLLGNSVLLTLLTGITTLFTTMLFSVGYAIMFFDLKLRNDADDLKDMIGEYNAR